jgi:3-oxoacid CoA-transferase subunit B
MLRRAAREVEPGMTVNLGIGLPTLVINMLPDSHPVCLHSENGITGVGPVLGPDRADRDLIDAGGAYVSALPGAAFMDSAVSFSLVRRGRLDLTMLGAFQVAVNGDLANWTIPGRFTPGPGGAIELAQKARRVVVLTTHQDKTGRSKIVKRCSLPLTAAGCVHRICTDMAVIDVTPEGMVLREIAEGLTVEEVRAATDAPLQLPPDGPGIFA